MLALLLGVYSCLILLTKAIVSLAAKAESPVSIVLIKALCKENELSSLHLTGS